MSNQENGVKEVVKEFTEADNAIKTVFSKVDPILVVRLIFDEKAKKENIYTLEDSTTQIIKGFFFYLTPSIKYSTLIY